MWGEGPQYYTEIVPAGEPLEGEPPLLVPIVGGHAPADNLDLLMGMFEDMTVGEGGCARAGCQGGQLVSVCGIPFCGREHALEMLRFSEADPRLVEAAEGAVGWTEGSLHDWMDGGEAVGPVVDEDGDTVFRGAKRGRGATARTGTCAVPGCQGVQLLSVAEVHFCTREHALSWLAANPGRFGPGTLHAAQQATGWDRGELVVHNI